MFLGYNLGISTMEWTTPQHEVVDLNCEVSSYANAELAVFECVLRFFGSAAGGGFPQWNCGCQTADDARRGLQWLPPSYPGSSGCFPAPAACLSLNASPDLRQQLLQDPDSPPLKARAARRSLALILMSARGCGLRDGPSPSARVPAAASVRDAVRAPRAEGGELLFCSPLQRTPCLRSNGKPFRSIGLSPSFSTVKRNPS